MLAALNHSYPSIARINIRPQFIVVITLPAVPKFIMNSDLPSCVNARTPPPNLARRKGGAGPAQLPRPVPTNVAAVRSNPDPPDRISARDT